MQHDLIVQRLYETNRVVPPTTARRRGRERPHGADPHRQFAFQIDSGSVRFDRAANACKVGNTHSHCLAGANAFAIKNLAHQLTLTPAYTGFPVYYRTVRVPCRKRLQRKPCGVGRIPQ